MSGDLVSAAIAWHHAGCAVVPVRPDGSKAPAVNWKDYQQQPPTLEQLHAWFTSDAFDGLGIITGTVSGNLEMLELEGRAVEAGAITLLDQLAADNDLDDLLTRVAHGCTVRSPSGGIHLLYRVTNAAARPNTKLARTPDRQVLAETRGEGGFIVAAPSAGRTHPTGRPWSIAAGSPQTIATITGEERDALYALVTMLDQEPPRDTAAEAGMSISLPGGTTSGTRPGDDYNTRTTWDDLLTPRGWIKVRRMGKGYAWRRPGKTIGISATTGQSTDGVDRLYVFTTSTEFDSERPYDKLGAYTLLEHGGDLTAAVRALAKNGYGTPPHTATSSPTPASARETTPTDVEGAVDAPEALPEPPKGEDSGNFITSKVTVDEPPATLAQSEDGHSQALIAEHGHEIRYVTEQGAWLWWDGWRWKRQPGGGIVAEFAKVIGRKYPDSDSWRVHKKRSLSAAGVTACLKLTSTDHRIAVSASDLDNRPWDLNTPVGIFDLRTGTLSPPDPRRLHTRSTAFAPDPDADPTPWLHFLDTTFLHDADMIGFIQRLMGYACVGTVREAILPVFFGQGANGKTVLLETVQAVLGDYAATLPPRFLVQAGQGVTDATVLLGTRLAVASETNDGERFDEAIVKRLTGGDTIRARYMRQDWFEFTPTHTLFLGTNHRPEVTAGGTSFWRRVREVPFTHVVPEDARDPELKDRLVTQHGPAILAWLIAGAAEYARTGLREPERVRVATQAYEASVDTVQRFVDDLVVLGGGDQVTIKSSIVRAAYEAWCRAEGETPISAKAFTTQLVARYDVAKTKGTHGVRMLTNLTLLNAETSNPDAPPEPGDDPWQTS